MKSVRRVKVRMIYAAAVSPEALKPVVGSTSQLNDGNSQAANDPATSGRKLLKPADQLNLTEKELDEELTRIINANNPHAAQNIARYSFKDRAFKAMPNIDHLIVHFEYDGYLVFTGGDRTALTEDGKDEAAAKQTAETTDQDGEETMATDAPKQQTQNRNQFNYSERAAQTYLCINRDKATTTEPPAHKAFSDTVTQWAIYDAYAEDLAQKEKVKEKPKASGKKDESAAANAAHSAASNDGLSHDDYKISTDVKKASSIVERMCNQNTFDEVIQDFKYWDDQADDFREGKGVLLPLWKFIFDKEHKKQVTALSWNHDRKDLFAAAYGSYDFTKQHHGGVIACFSLKNPSFPEFLFKTESGVMCLDFHKKRHSFIAAGLYDGTVVVYDLSKKTDVPLFKSTAKTGKHTEPVWEVRWQNDDLDEHPTLISVSSDGRVTQWTLFKNELVSTDIMILRKTGSALLKEEDPLFALMSGTCFDVNQSDPDIFIVGTDDGKIFKCSKAFNNQYLLAFEGHQMGVYAVRYSPFVSHVFLSASADWTVKLWDHDVATAVMMFDLNSSVGDIFWSPVSSTIFACATADGKVVMYDLNESKFEPICDQAISKKAKMTHIAFNNVVPIMVVGDDSGHILSMKLSPNLRKLGKASSTESQPEKMERVLAIAMGKRLEDKI